MTPAVELRGVGKRFGRRWALRDCTLEIPAGAIVGLTGPNAAGKSTLLALAAGLLTPSEGAISVLGADPRQKPSVLAEVGYVPQGAPLYRSFTIAETIEFARRTNPRWDAEIGARLLSRMDAHTKVGDLTVGERTQLALALVLGKRPRLLLLDEPFAGVDPFVGHESLQLLMDGVAETSSTVLIASNVMADIERVCDEIVLLAAGQVRLEGRVETLLESHRILMGPRRPIGTIRGVREILRERHSGRQLTLLVLSDGPIVDPAWMVDHVGLEELLLAYLAPERLPQPTQPERLPLRWHG